MCKLIEAVLLAAPGRIDSVVPSILELTLARYQSAKTRSLLVLLLAVAVNCVFYSPRLVFGFLESKGWTLHVLKLWLDQIPHLPRLHDKVHTHTHTHTSSWSLCSFRCNVCRLFLMFVWLFGCVEIVVMCAGKSAGGVARVAGERAVGDAAIAVGVVASSGRLGNVALRYSFFRFVNDGTALIGCCVYLCRGGGGASRVGRRERERQRRGRQRRRRAGTVQRSRRRTSNQPTNE
jgi:hypothetical protein